jgi:hypothetical protein
VVTTRLVAISVTSASESNFRPEGCSITVLAVTDEGEGHHGRRQGSKPAGAGISNVPPVASQKKRNSEEIEVRTAAATFLEWIHPPAGGQLRARAYALTPAHNLRRNCDQLRKTAERIELDRRHPGHIERRIVGPYRPL